MKIYYSKSTTGFYLQDVNEYIPDDSIEINKEKHFEMVAALSSGCIILEDLSYSPPKPSIFHNWIDGVWVLDNKSKLKAEMPQFLNRFQMLTVLRLTKLDNGSSLYQSADNYLNALTDDTIERVTIKTAWETAQEFSRDSALIGLIQTEFKLTDAELDDLFRQGLGITA